MSTLKIVTFNTQTCDQVPQLEWEIDAIKRARQFSRFLASYKIDIAGIQEVSHPFYATFKEYSKEQYHINGNFCFGNHINQKRNEANPIISSYPMIENHTQYLPWVPKTFMEVITGIQSKSIIPQMASYALIKTPEKPFIMMNTELSKANISIQKRQLQKLRMLFIEIRRQYPNIPMVLTGKFNIPELSRHFDDVYDLIEDFSMKKVPTPVSSSKKVLNTSNHIFIPRNWQIESVEGVKNHLGFHDPVPVLVKVSK